MPRVNNNDKLRTISTAEEWMRLHNAWKNSGEPQKDFCQKHKIAHTDLIYWRSKLAKAKRSKLKRHIFKEITVIDNASSLSPPTRQNINITMPGNTIVTLPTDIDEKRLTMLFKCLRG